MALNPISEYLDKPLLRTYRKIGKIWEDRGHSIYSLSSIIGIPSFWGLIYSLGTLAEGSIKPPFLGFGNGALNGCDLFYNLRGITGLIKGDYNTDVIVIDPMTNFDRKINRLVRVPEFLAGLGFVAKASYDIFRSVTSNEPLDPNAGLYFGTGLSFLGLSSSMYLKDKDPKLLQKEPSILKAGIKKMANKIKDLLPEPTPVPKPAFSSASELQTQLYTI
ncbi:MAG: hypothetical protein HYW23_02735 [Candidatus Aenigmarchaeota archaeon]|nr:hypothetical protein [Candidatus Aenigmarchaeota archaeon]